MNLIPYFSAALIYLNLIILHWLIVHFDATPLPAVSIALYGATYYITMTGHIGWSARRSMKSPEWVKSVKTRHRKRIVALALLAACAPALTDTPISIIFAGLVAHVYLTVELSSAIALDD